MDSLIGRAPDVTSEDSGIYAEFERAKCLLDRVSWPLAITGIWPKHKTLSNQFMFIIFMTYFTAHIILEFVDLVDIIGNLDLVILNLMETGLQTMIMSRILLIRFNKVLRSIISSIEEELMPKNFKDSDEMKIFINHSNTADNFYRVGAWFGTGGAIMWYLMPLQNYLAARLMNTTAVLITPYRIYTFVDISSIERTLIVYACQVPMVYASIAYVTSYSVMVAIVSNFCGHLAVLSHRLTNLKNTDANPRIVFQEHTQRHLKVFFMAQSLNDAFHLVLFYELVVTTVLIGLLVYNFLVHVDEADPVALFGITGYIIALTVLVYANCFMGEYLNTECNALLNSYYECNWFEMSSIHKQALLICMKTTQAPIRITAGKFYIFSMESFTKIMKSSMVYVSVLRTIND